MRSTSALVQCIAFGAAAGVLLQTGSNAMTAGGSGQVPAVTSPQRSRVTYDSYILGPGDSLQIELLDIPELSGSFSIGPDGTIYLPRLRALYVEGLTVEELRYFLTEQFKAYVKNPELYVRPLGYRPIRIYVGGEVRRPGYYTLSDSRELNRLSESAEEVQISAGTATSFNRPGVSQAPGGNGLSTFGAAAGVLLQTGSNAMTAGGSGQVPAVTSPQRSRVTYDSYILGPGDSLQIELLDIPELSGSFSIGPDGTIYLPRLRALYVEGLTVEELRYFLTEQFKAYVKNP